MRTERPHPGTETVVLDYSRSALRRHGVARWVRTFWSHRARLELARTASFKQGLWLLAGVSAIAGVLSTSHLCLRSFIAHAIGAPNAMAVLRHEIAAHWPIVLASTLAFAPIFFGFLVGFLAAISGMWTRLSRRNEPWSAAFPMLSVGCVPVLWFFVLLQLEGVAPFVGKNEVWYLAWNPVTNCVRFAVLMIGIVLAGIWIVDASRMYYSIRERAEAIEAAGQPQST